MQTESIHSENVLNGTEEHDPFFSPGIFDPGNPMYGIGIIAVNEPDGKLVFFSERYSASG